MRWYRYGRVLPVNLGLLSFQREIFLRTRRLPFIAEGQVTSAFCHSDSHSSFFSQRFHASPCLCDKCIQLPNTAEVSLPQCLPPIETLTPTLSSLQTSLTQELELGSERLIQIRTHGFEHDGSILIAYDIPGQMRPKVCNDLLSSYGLLSL